MAIVGFDTGELEEMNRAFEEMQRDNELMKECVRELGRRIIVSAKLRTHAVTGQLRADWKTSIERKGRGYVLTLSNTKKYATYVEYGHRTRDHEGWVEGQFFGENAIRACVKRLPEIVVTKMNRRLR